MPRAVQYQPQYQSARRQARRNYTTWELEVEKSTAPPNDEGTGNDGPDGKGKAKATTATTAKKVEMTDCPVCEGSSCNTYPHFDLDDGQKPVNNPYPRNKSCKGGKTKVKPKKKKGEVTSLPLNSRPHFKPGIDWHTKGGSKYLAFRDTMAGSWTVEDAAREVVQNLIDEANGANHHRESIVKESVKETKDESTKDESEDEGSAGPAPPPKSKIKSRLIQFQGAFSHDDGNLTRYQKAYLRDVCKLDSEFKGEKLAVAEIEFRYDQPDGNWHITNDEKAKKETKAVFTEVKLTNFGVSGLARDILSLGYSTKVGDARLIGKHGDGLKAALAVFARNGITVEFENGFERWRCGTRPHSHGMYNIIARKNRVDPLPFTIILRGPAGKLDPLYGDIRNKFLTLASPEILKWCVPVQTHSTVKGRLLLHPSHKGCIYIKGVFICKMNRLKYGVDVSSGCDVGRDRNTVDVDDMLEIICKLWAGSVAAPYLRAVELTAAEANLVETVHVKDVGVCIKSATGAAAEKLKPGMHIAFKDGESTHDSSSVYLKDAVGKVELMVSIEVAATIAEEASTEEQRAKRRRTMASTSNTISSTQPGKIRKHPSPREIFFDMLYDDDVSARHPWEEVVMIDGDVAEEMFSKSACEGIAEEFNYRFGQKTIASGLEEIEKNGGNNMLDLLPDDHRRMKSVSGRLFSVLSQVSRPSLHDIIKKLSANLVSGNRVDIIELDARAKEKQNRVQYFAKNVQFGRLQIMDPGDAPCLKMWSTSLDQAAVESVVYVSKDTFNDENIESLTELIFKLKSWECCKRGTPMANVMMDAYKNQQRSPYFSENGALLNATGKPEEVSEDDAGEADANSGDDTDSGPGEEEFMWLTVDHSNVNTAELRNHLRDRDANQNGAKDLLRDRLDALLTDQSEYIKTAEDIENNYAFIKRPTKEEWDQPGYVLDRVVKDGMVLSRAGTALRNDPDIVIAAVKQNGLALEHASTECQNDRAVVIAAVMQNGLALEYASAECQKDQEAVKVAFLQNKSSLQFAGYQASGFFISEFDRLTKQVERHTAELQKHTETTDKVAEKLAKLEADSEAKGIAMTQSKDMACDLKIELEKAKDDLAKLVAEKKECIKKLEASTERCDDLKAKLDALSTVPVHHLDGEDGEEKVLSFEEALAQKRRREADAKADAERLRDVIKIKVEAQDDFKHQEEETSYMQIFSGKQTITIERLVQLAIDLGGDIATINEKARVL